MALGLWVFVGWMAFVALTAIVFLIWGWRRGQFRNIEEAKYRMLEDREPADWPDCVDGNNRADRPGNGGQA